MNKVVWLNRGAFPVFFGFCPSEKAWKREMKMMSIENVPYPVLNRDACCSQFRKQNGLGHCAIVTLSEALDKKYRKSRIGLYGLLAHEAQHILRFTCEIMGEHDRSSEFEAYELQSIFMQLCQAYEDTRGANAKLRILRKRGGSQRVSRGARKQRVGGGRKQPRQRTRGRAAKGKRVARRKIQKRV